MKAFKLVLARGGHKGIQLLSKLQLQPCIIIQQICVSVDMNDPFTFITMFLIYIMILQLVIKCLIAMEVYIQFGLSLFIQEKSKCCCTYASMYACMCMCMKSGPDAQQLNSEYHDRYTSKFYHRGTHSFYIAASVAILYSIKAGFICLAFAKESLLPKFYVILLSVSYFHQYHNAIHLLEG